MADNQTIEVDEGAFGKKYVKMDFPANSHKAITKQPEKPEEKKKVEKVITGAVLIKKPSFGKRILNAILGDGATGDGVVSYIVHDVLIPAAKDTLEDLVKGSIEVLLRGEVKGSRTNRSGGKSYVSYSNYYNSSRRDDRRDDRQAQTRNTRSGIRFDDFVFGMRGEAEDVLSSLVDIVDEYGMATVADLYDLCGMTGNFTDNKFGWTNLSESTVSRVREGYMINLPKPQPLD
jgi:hypothetical protein